ncbi:MAG: exosortase/archaeosortase family protein [Janthinobacterium lividum]
MAESYPASTFSSAPPAPTREGLRDPVTLLLLAAALGMFLFLAWSRLAAWFSDYVQPDSYYAYGPFIPPLVGLMLWHRRRVLRSIEIVPSWAALGLLLPALALLVAANKKELVSLASAGVLLCLWGGIWLIFGSRWTRAAAFPLGFLVWMAPLPGPLLHDGTYDCQKFSTVLADRTLHLLTFPTHLNGNIIALDNFTLFVDVPCSGMKMLLTMLMIGAACAWLTDGLPLRRVGLFLFSFPLSLAMNVLRLTTLCVVGECLGAHAEHMIHDSSGALSSGLGLILLILTARGIGCRTFAGWPLP